MSWIHSLPDVATLLTVTAMMVSIATGLISAEFLYLYRELRPKGLFTPHLARLRAPRSHPLHGVLALLYRPDVSIALLGLGLAASVSTFVHALFGVLHAPSVIALALLTMYKNVRFSYGGDGSDQMSTIVVIPLAFASLWPAPDGPVVALVFAFIALASVLSYLTSGLVKLLSPQWRRGTAIYDITSTVSYGIPALTRFLKRWPALGKLGSWTVVSLECLFPLLLFLPYQLSAGLLILFAVFHLGNAIVMGLNAFVWAFIATYPAILWLCAQLQVPADLLQLALLEGYASSSILRVDIIGAMTPAELLVSLFGLGLAAKVIVEDISVIMERPAQARIWDVIAYCLVLFLASASIPSALLVAVAIRLLYTVRYRYVFASPNHPFLELLLLCALLFGQVEPRAMLLYLQLIAVSVWVYAGVQKLLSEEVRSGLFFYHFFSARHLLLPTQRLVIPGFLPLPRPMEGEYGALDPRALRFATFYSWMVVAVEITAPLLVFALAGTLWAVAGMLLLSAVVGLLAREWSFMMTNLLFALLFAQSVDAQALSAALAHPVLAGLFAWLAIWPCVHIPVARLLRFSPWRLFGWGMYTCYEPSQNALSAAGESLAQRTLANADIRASTGKILLRGFAMTRIPGLAALAQRTFARWTGHGDPAAFELSRYLRRGDRYTREFLLIPRSDDAPWKRALRFEVRDEQSANEYRQLRTDWLERLEPTRDDQVSGRCAQAVSAERAS